jgi:NTP pyrophosphatase (non-canonical NTP hydrolase)
MDFSAMTARALAVQTLYEDFEQRTYGRAWSLEELTLGLIGDVGDLAKLIQAHEGVREIDDVAARLGHELADVLWSVIVIADRAGVDLTAAFETTMDALEQDLCGDVAPPDVA